MCSKISGMAGQSYAAEKENENGRADGYAARLIGAGSSRRIGAAAGRAGVSEPATCSSRERGRCDPNWPRLRFAMRVRKMLIRSRVQMLYVRRLDRRAGDST